MFYLLVLFLLPAIWTKKNKKLIERMAAGRYFQLTANFS